MSFTLSLIILCGLFWIWLLGEQLHWGPAQEARALWQSVLIIAGLGATLIIIYRTWASATGRPGGWGFRSNKHK